MKHPNAQIVVCQVFLMLGLGMSIRMCNYMTHMFLGGVFQHCTCVPVVIVDRRVYFGKHPYINIVNWGEGNDRTPEERARLKAERDKRNRLRELGLQRLARRRERSRRTTEQQQRSATS